MALKDFLHLFFLQMGSMLSVLEYIKLVVINLKIMINYHIKKKM